MIVLQKLAKSL